MQMTEFYLKVNEQPLMHILAPVCLFLVILFVVFFKVKVNDKNSYKEKRGKNKDTHDL